jgi:putative peptidoglycan lipid II flippase
MSLVILVFILVAAGSLGIEALAWGTLLGVLSMVLLQLPAWRDVGYRPKIEFGPGTRRFLKLGATFLLGTVLYSLIGVAAKIFASRLPEGSISCLDYASRLVGVVYSVLAMITLAVFPSLCQAAIDASGRLEFQRLLEKALRALLFLAIPSALFLAVFHVPVIRFVYERGAFDRESAQVTANLLVFYAGGNVLFALNNLLVHAFYARREMGIRVWYGALQLVVFVLAASIFTGPLGVRGLVLAEIVAAVAGSLFLVQRLRRRNLLFLSGLLRPTGVFSGISLLAVGGAWLLMSQVTIAAGRYADLLLPAALAAMAFLLLAYVVRLSEMFYVVDLAKRLLRRGRA